MIPYGRQDINQADIDAAVEALRSDFLTQGPMVPAFEQAIAAKVGAKHAIAVNSATSALHIACLALELGPGDYLWTVPNSFVASANCGRYCGAEVDFVDIDPLTWNLCPQRLKEKLIQAKKEDRLPKIVVPVLFAGQPTDQEAIWELSREYGFRVIEDASHAIGASRNGEPVGSCQWSDITILSFHPVKIITAGEGGMALTNDDALSKSMSMLRSHGIIRDPAWRLTDQHEAEVPYVPERRSALWYYEQQTLGYNYRMTEIQAALGLSQLQRLDAFIERRNALAQRYNQELKGLPLRLPTILPGNRSSFHLYVIRLKLDSMTKTHRQVFDELWERGISVNVHYMPVHLQPYYRELGFRPTQYPESEAHGDEAITLPLFPTLTDQEQDHVITALRDIL